MRTARVVLVGATLTGMLGGCRPDRPDAFRGTGLNVAPLPSADIVAVYRAALGGSFTLGDPSLSILVDSLFLPRGSGLAGGAPMPVALFAALRDAGLIRGSCTIPVQKTRQPLVCDAPRAGYAVRFSEPFALGTDSVQVHIVVEQYAIPGGPRAERLRFERAYHVVRRGPTWRAVREGRMPQP